ncbi:MAG: HAD-IIB family hydrolase [Desulfurococcales archaeon]|nr:HAD-IIB family hydrolase [Desulfurococcales archaeon]MEB3789600.1 HAD-IIB family hydrolase [Desulfurococcales archaeon]
MYGRLVVFSDIDHTMMSNKGDLGEVPGIIDLLESAGIPVVLVTAKTISEVISLRRSLGIKKWFIAVIESGAAIFADPGILPYVSGRTRLVGEELEYVELTAKIDLEKIDDKVKSILKERNIECDPPLVNVWDLSGEELSRITGLPVEQAKLIPTRDYMLVYYTPDMKCKEKIKNILESRGFYVGLGRNFIHIGLHRGKGWAVRWIMERVPGIMNKTSIGLGDSAPDVDFLEVVDVPIIIPHPTGPRIRLARPDYSIAPYPAPSGWVSSLQDYIVRNCSGLVIVKDLVGSWYLIR